MSNNRTSRIQTKAKKWCEGEYVPPPPNDPSSPLFFVRGGSYKKSRSAAAITVLASFWSKHWQWTIGLLPP